MKRTPRNLYKIPTEGTPLLTSPDGSVEGSRTDGDDEESNGEESVVKVAIYVNFAANTFLLAAKTAVIALTNSLSVLASLVDAALDFLSTAIVWTTSKLVARQDQYTYPVGRRRLEPIGVLVFSVIMITSFSQVLLESFNRLNSGDHSIVQLTLPATIIMAGTVVVKFACWLWCRLIKNSSVQALAQDAMTDVVFNTFSIIFPLGSPPPLLRSQSFSNLTNTHSRLLRQNLVARRPRRRPPLPIRHHQLVTHVFSAHPEPQRRRRQRGRAQHPALPYHAFRQGDQADSGSAGVPRRRQAERRG